MREGELGQDGFDIACPFLAGEPRRPELAWARWAPGEPGRPLGFAWGAPGVRLGAWDELQGEDRPGAPEVTLDLTKLLASCAVLSRLGHP